MKKVIFIIIAVMSLFWVSMTSNAATSTSQAGIVETGGSNLNVRQSATTSSSIIGKVKDKGYVTILSTSGSFYYVEYQENLYGYVHKDYVKIVSSSVRQVNTEGSNLNVRTGPSTSYTQFEKIKDRDYVIILSNSGSFSRVLFEGNKTGYVSNDYLTSAGYAYKQLSVPSYKQYDSRWASLPLGSKGDTIREIGCLKPVWR